MLTPFKKVLNDPAPKKFIVVHLLGTHIKYKYRYPELAKWGRFAGKNDNVPAKLNQDEQATYNGYDNANLYNDNVLSRLIANYKATDPNGFMLYFSNHGEEVYDTAPHTILGRNESNPTRAMYTIPFFVWTSDKWQAANPRYIRGDVSRKFSLMNLIYTWSDLARLSYDGYDPTRSLVNPQFVQTLRWIGNLYHKDGLRDFDTLANSVRSVSVTQ